MKTKISCIFFTIFLLCTPAYAQSRKELEARKKKNLEELAITNKLLNETNKQKRGTQNKVNLLRRSINKSNEYINTLNTEITMINGYIDSLRTEKKSLEYELTMLKADYAKLHQMSYRQQKNCSPLIFILSSESFSQSVRRFRYLQEISNLKRIQSQEIQRVSNTLNEKENQLTDNIVQKETVLSTKALEAQRLKSQKASKDRELASLKKKETTLRAKQKRQQKLAAELNSKIQKVIAEEIKKQNAKNKGNSSNSSPYQMSKEETLVAGNFAKNKGKLPLPVIKGFVSGHFGVQRHPELNNVTIDNKGTYIQTPAGSDARCIFEGIVTQCFSVPGSNNSVIVKHGNYRTVYSNLTNLYIKVGDKITTKQKIGKIFIDKENDNKTELYLMIYKDTNIQNPEHWLAL